MTAAPSAEVLPLSGILRAGDITAYIEGFIDLAGGKRKRKAFLSAAT